jgi:hypothetical protein
MDRRIGLRTGRHRPQTAEARRFTLHIDAGISLYTLMQVFSVTVFEKISIESVVFQSIDSSAYVIDDKQLNLFSD